MGKSLPPPTAPVEAAPREKSERQRRGLRVPTSLLVTLSVAVLSVWVGPAFARQWDDRQKARELKASLAESIAFAAGAAIADGRARETDTGVASGGELKYARRWDVAALRIEVQLRAYTPSLVAEWRAYATTMGLFFTTTGHLVAANNGVERRNADPLESLRFDYPDLVHQVKQLLPGAADRYGLIEWSDAFVRPDMRIYAIDNLANALLAASGPFIDRLLAVEPEGFSTTRGDLLRDLLP
jgi:hypothetical protein